MMTMKWMDRPSVTEIERGGVTEMDRQKSAKTWKCNFNRSNVITHSSTCKKNLIKFDTFQWHGMSHVMCHM